MNTSSFVWKNTLGQTFPYNNGVLNIPSAQAGTVGYFLSMTSTQCQVVSGSLSDTSFITGVSASVTATSTPDICSSGQGTVTANPGAGMAPFTFNWPALGATTQSVTGVFGGTYLVKITDAMGCQASATVTVTNTPATFS
ncbi:MAG TPA: PKD domain-containing protein, partial [Fluviicola sp.]|nr:PKD domain-containing protein [Fluviicola sp.]